MALLSNGWKNRDFIPKKENLSGGSKIVATYDYKDANGKLLFQVVRFEPKTFRQRRPNGSGGWSWKLDNVERVLYRLPELLAALPTTIVYVAEGEKDVDALHERCLIATTNPGGVGKWSADYNAYFRGRRVVILSDNDPQATNLDGSLRSHADGRPMFPGQDHAADVATNLRGIAADVRVLMLPGLPSKGDVSDWFAAGGTGEELERLVDTGEPDAPVGDAEPAQDRQPKPIIKVEAGQIDILATEAEDALIRSTLPVFQRGDSLVRPMSWEVCASDERSTLAAGLKEIRIPALIDLLSQAASWRRYDARAKKLKAIDPPSSVASIVLSRAGSWRLPSILGVITTPTMRRDGSILSEHGYDKVTRLFHMRDPSLHMQPIGTTRIDAEHSLFLLQESAYRVPIRQRR